MSIIDIIIRVLFAAGLIAIRLYWLNAENDAKVQLPETRTRKSRFLRILRFVEYGFLVLLVIQFFGVQILPFHPNLFTRALAILLFLLGTFISIEGRRALDVNWSRMINYQVKDKQALVTDGIYKYSRHPIYGGAILIFTSVELALGSWLVIPVFLLISYIFYIQSKKEEGILARHFPKEYLQYMHHTKMFIPFVF